MVKKKEQREEKQQFIPMQLHLQIGDVITSKKGVLQHSAVTDELFLTKKFKVNGENFFEVIGDNKEKIDVHIVKEKKEVRNSSQA